VSAAMVVIPARLASSRLPRKMLLDVGGRPLLQRTHEVAVRARCGPVLVLADDQEVVDVVRGFGGEVRLTDPALESGTARLASVVETLDAEVLVNLQGDAPLTDPEVVAAAARETAATGADVTMAVYPLTDAADVLDPNVVKVVRGHDGRVLYCSRSPVPHVRDAPTSDWPGAATFWGHSGIYAYGRAFLSGFAALPPSPLETAERLEQLRWLQAGAVVRSFEVAAQGPSVDTDGQLERVRLMLGESSPPPAR